MLVASRPRFNPSGANLRTGALAQGPQSSVGFISATIFKGFSAGYVLKSGTI